MTNGRSEPPRVVSPVTMRGIVAGVIAIAALLAGCGTDAGPGPPEAGSTAGKVTLADRTAPSTPTRTRSPTAAPSEQARRGRLVTTAGSAYGTMLFDRSGQAIYLFDKENTSSPECYGACAEAWPPVLTQGKPQVEGAARSHLLGTTRRNDGSRQVTYAGQPLYFYAHEGRNEVLCHNVSEFGGLWLVVTPNGEAAD